MQKEVYAVRIDKSTRAALEAAAAGSGSKPRTLAHVAIVDYLQRRGYLPKSKPVTVQA